MCQQKAMEEAKKEIAGILLAEHLRRIGKQECPSCGWLNKTDSIKCTWCGDDLIKKAGEI